VGDLVASIQYSKLDNRLAFAEKLVDVRRTFEAITVLANPPERFSAAPVGPQNDGDRAAKAMLSAQLNFHCIKYNMGQLTFLNAAICEKDRPPVNLAISLEVVDSVIAKCLYAVDENVVNDCDTDKVIDQIISLGALFPPSAGGMKAWMTKEAIDKIKAQYPDVDLDKALTASDHVSASDNLGVVDMARKEIAKRFPEIQSIDTLRGVTDGIFGKVVPKTFRKNGAGIDITCNKKASWVDEIVRFDGTQDVRNVDFDIDLDYTGPHIPDKISILIPEQHVRHSYTWRSVSFYNEVPIVDESWLVSDCSMVRTALKGPSFDLKAELLKVSGAAAKGEISVAYWDLHGHHEVTVESFKVSNGKIFLTDIF
jgi:hypothetical protein